jgi:hypothetical protein
VPCARGRRAERRRQRPEAFAVQLYQRLLGASFERLPPVLRRFHAQGGGEAECTFAVGRHAGPLHGLVARAAGLPAVTPSARVVLHVRVDGEREFWTRVFPDRSLRTAQWLEQGRLIEQAGPLQVSFDVAADESGMRIISRGCRVFGVPLPRAFAPAVTAMVHGAANGWEVEVMIALPLLGTIGAYSGTVVPA